MSGHHIRPEPVTQYHCGDHRMKEYSRLCNPGLSKVFICSREHQVGYPEPEVLVSLFEQCCSLREIFIQFLAHSCELGALTGKDICFHGLSINFGTKIITIVGKANPTCYPSPV